MKITYKAITVEAGTVAAGNPLPVLNFLWGKEKDFQFAMLVAPSGKNSADVWVPCIFWEHWCPHTNARAEIPQLPDFREPLKKLRRKRDGRSDAHARILRAFGCRDLTSLLQRFRLAAWLHFHALSPFPREKEGYTAEFYEARRAVIAAIGQRLRGKNALPRLGYRPPDEWGDSYLDDERAFYGVPLPELLEDLRDPLEDLASRMFKKPVSLTFAREPITISPSTYEMYLERWRTHAADWGAS